MIKKQKTYRDQQEQLNVQKTQLLLNSLPEYLNDYFRAITPTTTASTRLSYAYDIRLFLRYLATSIKKSIREITLHDIENVTEQDIEKYLDYLTDYTDDMGHQHYNSEQGKFRKLVSLRSFYDYYYKRQIINNNPTLLSPNPKIRSHEIIRLTESEIEQFLDFLDIGSENMSGIQAAYFNKNKTRNMAICTLLLGTGIRVSECAGLNIQDIDFLLKRIRIVRKGGKMDFVYFGQEVETEISKYMSDRRKIIPLSGHENALFLSSQKKRMCVHAIENMVTSYSSLIFDDKRITPHKLRSTFGTALYRYTGDIFLVAEVLGHNDVNTTKKHYTTLDEDRKKMASNVIKLRHNNT